jgi:hypothetical protein
LDIQTEYSGGAKVEFGQVQKIQKKKVEEGDKREVDQSREVEKKCRYFALALLFSGMSFEGEANSGAMQQQNWSVSAVDESIGCHQAPESSPELPAEPPGGGSRGVELRHKYST